MFYVMETNLHKQTLTENCDFFLVAQVRLVWKAKMNLYCWYWVEQICGNDYATDSLNLYKLKMQMWAMK